jgi:hypothetical protein
MPIPESSLPLDQVHAQGLPCYVCGTPMLRDGVLDGHFYHDACSRPWYTCPECGECADGETLTWITEHSDDD